LEPGTLELLEEYITSQSCLFSRHGFKDRSPNVSTPSSLVSPNGMMFVKPTLRKSLLAKMLAELLDTRVMIKTSMKGYKSDKVCRLLPNFSQ
jgi:hypothetical protein